MCISIYGIICVKMKDISKPILLLDIAIIINSVTHSLIYTSEE